MLTDAGEAIPPEYFYRRTVLEFRQVKFGGLHESRQVNDDQNLFVFELAHEGEHFVVAGVQELEATPAKRPKLLALSKHALHPPQQRVRIILLRLNVDCLVVILRVDVDGQIKL